MRGCIRAGLTLVTVAVIWTAVVVAAPFSAGADEESCQDFSVPVLPTLLQTDSMHAQHCRAIGAWKRATLVLVPGATYTQTYWNFPFRPDLYNFRLAMNRAGFDTVTVDRLGTGASSRPPSALVTATSQAAAVHQVIQKLRRDQPNQKIIIGGHSLGSAITALEAATYHDVSAVLLTGISHNFNKVGVASFFAGSARPAAFDPRIGRRGYDPGYLTTLPGTRAEQFYAPGTAEPGVAETDEKTKDVVSSAEVADGLPTISVPLSQSIDVPVMLANSAEDKLFCGPITRCESAEALKASEAPYFSPAADLHTYVLPNFGHDINLAPNTDEYHRAVIDWATSIDSRRGRGQVRGSGSG